MSGVEPEVVEIEPEAAISFLGEAALYFGTRSTNGEDKAHWANVYNAANCQKIAALIERITRATQESEGGS